MKTVMLKSVPESEADTHVGRPTELVATEIAGRKKLRLHDGMTPGGHPIGEDQVEALSDAQSADPAAGAAGYFQMHYKGATYSGVNAPYMLHQAWATLNGTKRLLGYWGMLQENSNNAAALFVLATRSTTGEPSIRYRVNINGEHVWLTPEYHNANVTFNDDGSGNTLVTFGAKSKFNGTAQISNSLNIDAEKTVTFGGANLRMLSKVGDPLTLQIDAVNARNIELLTNNAVRIKIDSSGRVLMPNLATSATGLPSGALWRDAAAGNVIKQVP